MNNLICPFCLQDITNNNHNWDCEINPININNNEFRPCTVNESFEQSLKEMLLMREGSIKKKSWEEFIE